MKYKKFSLLMLMIGMLCAPIEQVLADEILNDDQVKVTALRWLSYDEKVQLLQDLLQGVQTSDLNIQLMVLNVSRANAHGMQWMVGRLKEIAETDQSEVITMKHAETLFDEIKSSDVLENLPEDLQADWTTCTQSMRWIALHEAGHAVALLCGQANKFLYLKSINMQSDTSRDGFIVGANHFLPLYEDQSELNEEELQAYVDVDLGGFAAEVVFKDLIGNQQPQLDGNDADQCGANVDRIMRKRSQGLYGFMDNKEEGQAVMVELYLKTVQLVQLHQDKVEKLALQLLKKKTLHADEIYQICGVEKPKLEIQRRSSLVDCKKKLNQIK